MTESTEPIPCTELPSGLREAVRGTPLLVDLPPRSSSPRRFPWWLFRPVHLDCCIGPWQFIRRVLAQQFGVKIIVAIAIGILIPDAKDANNEAFKLNPFLMGAILVFVAPMFETLLLQAAPIEILRALRRSKRLQFLLGSIPFAALHFPNGAASGIAAGIVGGMFFSYTYLECRNRSWWTAVWVTTATHAIHNLICLPVLIITLCAK